MGIVSAQVHGQVLSVTPEQRRRPPQPSHLTFGLPSSRLLPSKEAQGAEVLLLTSVAPLPVFSNFTRKPRFPKIPQLQVLTNLQL